MTTFAPMISDKTKNSLIKIAILAFAILAFLMLSRCSSEEDPQPAAKRTISQDVTFTVRQVSDGCIAGAKAVAWVDIDDTYEAAQDIACAQAVSFKAALKPGQVLEINIFSADNQIQSKIKKASFEYTFTQNGITETVTGDCGCTSANGHVRYVVK